MAPSNFKKTFSHVKPYKEFRTKSGRRRSSRMHAKWSASLLCFNVCPPYLLRACEQSYYHRWNCKEILMAVDKKKPGGRISRLPREWRRSSRMTTESVNFGEFRKIISILQLIFFVAPSHPGLVHRRVEVTATTRVVKLCKAFTSTHRRQGSSCLAYSELWMIEPTLLGCRDPCFSRSFSKLSS